MTHPVPDRQVKFFTTKLLRLDDFKGCADEASSYAQKVIETMRQKFGKGEAFTDQLLCLGANVANLNGEIKALKILPEDLAVMTETQILSRQQKQKQEALIRKRAREKTSYDKTNMFCKKCGLVRRDRININELGLDSEENGTQFDYNFDNTCACSHSSEEDSDDNDAECDTDGDERPDKRAKTETDTSTESAAAA